MKTPDYVYDLVAMPANQLATVLSDASRDFKVTDMVVEIAPRGFRIVRDGNNAQGVFISRHALMGLLICLLGVMTTTPTPDAFWKEVLS
ncbi:MAG TPA: hypothetical protein VL357_05895 [Rariglobus sp.]|jgi:hypothetical protein|nr:hypothetical protein [Rariglobus sp.]